MPNTASAKKRLRQNESKRLQNRAARSSLRSQIRRVRDAVKAGDSAAAQSQFRLAQKSIDQAASRNLIHRNAAARTKSRLVDWSSQSPSCRFALVCRSRTPWSCNGRSSERRLCDAEPIGLEQGYQVNSCARRVASLPRPSTHLLPLRYRQRRSR